LSTRRRGNQPDVDVALGWHALKRPDDEIVLMTGGTGGYRSFAGFSVNTKKVSVILSNTGGGIGVADIGLHTRVNL